MPVICLCLNLTIQNNQRDTWLEKNIRVHSYIFYLENRPYVNTWNRSHIGLSFFDFRGHLGDFELRPLSELYSRFVSDFNVDWLSQYVYWISVFKSRSLPFINLASSVQNHVTRTKINFLIL